jgi:transcriptional antiterminator Rof (Rho-off)
MLAKGSAAELFPYSNLFKKMAIEEAERTWTLKTDTLDSNSEYHFSCIDLSTTLSLSSAAK